MNTPDPITVQVIGASLVTIAEEMGAVLRRASYSTNIKERSDCSTALFDERGRLVAQAENMPIHMGSMTGLIDSLEASALTVRPGDVFITNDPYHGGGTHLPDITMVKPVFADDELIGYSANIAHHSDIGGRVPGSNAGDSNSLFQEGLRIPLVRFATADGVEQAPLAFVELNSRLPHERRGDMLAQLASVEIGERQLREVHRRYGRKTVRAATAYLLEHSRKRLAAALREVPDGTYRFRDLMDPSEGPATEIEVAITITGDRVALDFAGTGPQSPVGINVVRPALEATVYYALKAVLDPGIPPNGGFFDAVEITAPHGSIVNPVEPAPVTARTDTCQRVADVVLGALAEAVPQRVPAASHSTVTYVTFSGECDGQFFVYPEVVAGGGGARTTKDGLDAIQVHITNSSNLPIEALEQEYPLLVDTYELIPDSGGAGTHRGGLGVRRDVRILCDEAEFSAHADRQATRPWGLHGGGDGSLGRFVVNPGRDDERPLPGGRVSGVRLRKGDVLRVESPGSGGFGDPTLRDPERLREDLHNGRITEQAARDSYGFTSAD
ncbi:hydantoinase B/oxoprolinase family protein [Saccharopolyspora phatthalungensis]|uniref:N-methylhydantoinase B n=1 Tax=Saccharopolyspora phatthalungensis TaxID=664693 RepID=A0A840Q9S8_9PSEU|nr:hydantoinase B/oxoprolinase family protein [Saccharopolyspora phatthalungensis]MBB5156600.1 N-methylhydantoinase B [Saccharopolyspora phatthalungensis]